MEITELVERLERVEKVNQRLQLAGGAMAAVLLGIALVGAVLTEQIPELIQAQRFQVIGENGNTRTAMIPDGIYYFEENGKIRTSIGLGFFVNDPDGTLRAGQNCRIPAYRCYSIRSIHI